jgi:tetratricopeptide (TPR) repeat protein
MDDRVTREMFNRDAPPRRDAAHALRVLRNQMETVEDLRDRPPREWPTEEGPIDALEYVGAALTELEWHDLARLAYLEKVALCRELASEQLGSTLESLRDTLMELGRYEEALPIVDEEREAWLGLVDTDEYAQESADTAQYWRTEILVKLGRFEDAVESAANAVSELRDQVARGAVDRGFALAYAVQQLADNLVRAGRVEEALPITAEVMAFWRAHADGPPGSAYYIDAMQALGQRQGRAGWYEEARATLDEAVRVVREGVGTGRYSQDELAVVLNNHGKYLSGIGRYREAVVAGAEAVDQARAYVEETRADQDDIRTAELYLCDALIDLGADLDEVGRVDEAVAAYIEAVAIARGHLDADPEESGWRLALALNNLSVARDLEGDHAGAVEAAQEAVAVHLRMADDARGLALARHTLSVALSNQDRHDEALAASTEAVASYRGHHEPADLAAALVDHGLIRSRRGEHDEALAATTEAVELLGPLAERDPGGNAGEHARALTAFAEVRLAAGDALPEARGVAGAAVARYEQLAESQPEVYGRRLEAARSVADRLR